MMKTYLHKVLTYAFALTLAFVLGTLTPVYAAENNDAVADVEEAKEISLEEAQKVAKTLTLDKVKTGVLDTHESENWYKFEIEERGIFLFKFAVNTKTDYNNIRNGWDVAIFRESDLGNSFKYVTGIKSDCEFPYLPMEKGTYYVRVKSNSTSQYYSAVGCYYDLLVDFMKTSSWEVEGPNDDHKTANEIILNKSYKGTIHYDGNVDWYKATVEKTGYLELYLGLAKEANVNWVRNGWNVYVYDTKNNLLKSYTGITSSTTMMKLPLAAGDYYIKVQGESDSQYYSPRDCVYELKLNFTENSSWESENNDSNTTADTIKAGKTQYGLLYHSSDVDFYKIKTAETGYFQINFSLGSSVNVDWIRDGWKITLYDSGLNKIITYNGIKSNWVSDKLPQAKGTYYIRVENSSTSDYYSARDCEYKIKVVETATSTWESENNNDRTKADSISLNKGYNGLTLTNDDADWFKFTLKNKGDIKLSFGKDSSTNIDNIGNGWNVYIYAKDSNTSLCTLEDAKTTKTGQVTLDAGTYYVKVIPNSSYYAPTGCEYDLKISYSQTPGKVKIKSITSGTKQLTITWEKQSKATGYYIYRATSKTGTYKKVATISDGATVKYVNKSLSAKKTYYYKVVAFNKSNGVTAVGAESAIKSQKTK